MWRAISFGAHSSIVGYSFAGNPVRLAMADVEMDRGALEENLNLTTDEDQEAPAQHISLRRAVVGGMVLFATAMAAGSLRGGLGHGGRPETAVLQQSSLLAAYAQDQGNPTWSYDAVAYHGEFRAGSGITRSASCAMPAGWIFAKIQGLRRFAMCAVFSHERPAYPGALPFP